MRGPAAKLRGAGTLSARPLTAASLCANPRANRLGDVQASGQWDKALEVAVAEDRINLRTTHFKYAQYLETVGDTTAAIKNYEASETHRRQVPRMLFAAQRFEDLEAYIRADGDERVQRASCPLSFAAAVPHGAHTALPLAKPKR